MRFRILRSLVSLAYAFVLLAGDSTHATEETRELMEIYRFTADLTEKLKSPGQYGEVTDMLHPAISRSLNKEMALKRLAASTTAKLLLKLGKVESKVESKALKIDKRELLPNSKSSDELATSFYQVFVRWIGVSDDRGEDIASLAETTVFVARDKATGKMSILHLSGMGTYSDLLTLHFLRCAVDGNFLKE
jgi:hypothetical protein